MVPPVRAVDLRSGAGGDSRPARMAGMSPPHARVEPDPAPGPGAGERFRPVAAAIPADGERPSAPSPVWPTPVQAALFLATVASTLLVGAMHEGANPFTAPETLVRGIPFAATLLSILLVHEMGHYIAARRSGVLVTLPYFIPAPTLLGTFGAFIRMRSPVTDRGALVMIGAAGPLAGFLIALPALWIGVATSHLGVIPDVAIQLGDSLIMRAAVAVIHGPIPAGQDLFLNSVGLAAWAGILVTALNLLPIGQLDGGHVAYALFGAKSRWIALGVLPLLFGLRHPPPLDPERPLRLRHRVVGLAALVVFVLCFIPVPLRLKP